MYLETNHEQSYKQIVDLENRQVVKEPSPELVFEPPTFIKPLDDAEQLIEGDELRLVTRLQPIADPTMRVSLLLSTLT